MNVVTLGRSLGLLKQLTDSTAATSAIVQTQPQKPWFEGRASECEYTSPESVGISSDMLYSYITEIYNNKNINVQSIVISRKGRTVVKLGFDGWDADIWKCAFSQSKSITSLAVGMLMGDGLLTPNTTLADIFGKRVPALSKGRFKDMTVLHLLTMSTGALFNEFQCVATDNWIKGFFTSGFSFEPGAEFNYNSLNSYMLSAIVTSLTGKTMSEFLDERLFKPLGITDYFWEKCPKGIDRGGWGLFIKPCDLTKIGQLLLQNGEWEGKRILSEKYVNAATTKRIEVPDSIGEYDYGFQIWTPRNCNGFLFNGMLGQNMFCYRDSGIIVTVNSGNTDMFQNNDLFPITDKYFNTPFADSLPRNKKAEKRLKELTDTLSRYRPSRSRYLYERVFRKSILKKNCQAVRGEYTVTSREAVSVGFMPVLMQTLQNNYTKGTLGYSFGDDEKGFYLIYKEEDGEYKLYVGFDKTEYTDIEIMGEKCRLGVSGEFKYNEDDLLVLKLRADFIEFPYTRYIKFIFTDSGVEAQYRETPGKEVLSGFDMSDVTKKIPSVLSSVTEAGAQQVIAKLGIAFERTLCAEKK
ncbi:MAG: serine hydrolase [Clostridia bacterium]|nr:serine hydrolase [Clostridia bacterium]